MTRNFGAASPRIPAWRSRGSVHLVCPLPCRYLLGLSATRLHTRPAHVPHTRTQQRPHHGDVHGAVRRDHDDDGGPWMRTRCQYPRPCWTRTEDVYAKRRLLTHRRPDLRSRLQRTRTESNAYYSPRRWSCYVSSCLSCRPAG